MDLIWNFDILTRVDILIIFLIQYIYTKFIVINFIKFNKDIIINLLVYQMSPLPEPSNQNVQSFENKEVLYNHKSLGF